MIPIACNVSKRQTDGDRKQISDCLGLGLQTGTGRGHRGLAEGVEMLKLMCGDGHPLLSQVTKNNRIVYLKGVSFLTCNIECCFFKKENPPTFFWKVGGSALGEGPRKCSP